MPSRYRFDDVEIDLRGFRVLKAGKVVSLEPKALNVLVFLVENRGRLIEKRELLDAVWGEAFVTENVLTRVIAQLRKALADGSGEVNYIETVPTRGYRFIAEVAVEENGEATANISAISDVAPSIPLGRSRPGLRRYAIAAAGTIVLACLVAVGVFLVRSRSGGEYLKIASNSQITTSSGLSFYPTFSPDNTEIAYSTDRGKGFEIFVRQLAAGGKEFQITSDGNQNMQPAWSPDGALMAYSSITRGGVWLIPALGGTPRKITDFGSHPSWSRDGQWIAFQSSALDDFSADSSAVFPPSTIWIIRPDGTGARQITRSGDPEGGHGAPSWSPDSKHITFISTGPSAVWSIAADGTGLLRLADSGCCYFDPVYSPDGSSVFFGAVTTSGTDVVYGLSQVRVSSETSVPLGKSAQIMNATGAYIKNLSFSRDGKKLIYAALTLTSSLQSLPLTATVGPAGELASLTSNVGCRSTEPAFSPDGTQISFVSCLGRAGLKSQIWSMNADGGNAHQLTFGTAEASYPSWYPDDRRILFESAMNGKYISLDSVDAGTLQQKPVVALEQNFNWPALSPDGTRVALELSRGGVFNIWLMEIPGGNVKQLTFDKEMAGFPAWSPDGKFISAEMQRGQDDSIGILSSAGGAITQLTPYQGRQWSRDWSVDGDKVLFAKEADDLTWNIWSVSRSTKVQKQLTHYTKSNAYVRYPAMSPRGNQVVYEYTETTGNIWLLELK